ncbi:hypothetical protein [Nitrincola tapanii]|uniref:Uncharacterized protein n=1 Tax=Nitrincola tapanii TaxID=1708751 RepID=A0A5A9W555_9GAMM|nr:hypothetical protein [Nitrincola tapanii]KAA0875920.1 hypothetical protein E1H14_04320 [Nitrincola tapanii]
MTPTDQTSAEDIVVIVNAENAIIEVAEGWTTAAKRQGADAQLAPEQVKGLDLADYIGSEVTCVYYEAALKLCRMKNTAICREYRCDSPTHKRFMQVILTPKAEGCVEMRHRLLHESPFKQRLDLRFADREPKLKGFHLRCSLCNSIKLENQSEWLAPESLLTDQPQKLAVIHGVCPNCEATHWRSFSLVKHSAHK